MSFLDSKKYKRLTLQWATSKLKPCPFCGDKAQMLHQDLPPNVPQDPVRPLKCYGIRCSGCNLMMKVFTRFQVQAIASWNRRTAAV